MKLLLNLKMRFQKTLDIPVRRMIGYLLWFLLLLMSIFTSIEDNMVNKQIDETTEQIVDDIKQGTFDYYFDEQVKEKKTDENKKAEDE